MRFHIFERKSSPSCMNAIKQNVNWQNIPVIVVSNSANAEKVNTMLALGAKKYLLKAEYRLDDIISMIRDLKVA